MAELDLAAPVAVEFTEDDASADEAARRHAQGYAFTIGAMGTGGRNYYNDAFGRLGFADEVAHVQELWRSSQRDQARNAVPIDLGRLTNLLGTEDEISRRIGLYRAAGITTLLAKLDGPHDVQLETLRRLVRLAAKGYDLDNGHDHKPSPFHARPCPPAPATPDP